MKSKIDTTFARNVMLVLWIIFIELIDIECQKLILSGNNNNNCDNGRLRIGGIFESESSAAHFESTIIEINKTWNNLCFDGYVVNIPMKSAGEKDLPTKLIIDFCQRLIDQGVSVIIMGDTLDEKANSKDLGSLFRANTGSPMNNELAEEHSSILWLSATFLANYFQIPLILLTSPSSTNRLATVFTDTHDQVCLTHSNSLYVCLYRIYCSTMRIK